MSKELYVIPVEVKALPGSKMAEEKTDSLGAFLYAFIKASDAIDAGICVKKALKEDCYEVICIEEILLKKSIELDEKEYKDIIDEALETEEVVYGPFYLYDETKNPTDKSS